MASDSAGQLGSISGLGHASGRSAIDIVSDDDSGGSSGASPGQFSGSPGHFGGSPGPSEGSPSDSDSPSLDPPLANPVPLSTSVVLDRSARKQAVLAGLEPAQFKISVRFKPVGSTAPISPQVFKIGSHQTVATLSKFLCRKLRRKSVYVYIQSSFQPASDENLGNLFNCFSSNNELVVNYCNTRAFG